MNEEIKVGEYVRTKKGYIGKIIKINNNTHRVVIDSFIGKDEDIIKHSKDIIGVIEPGDYVNGEKVTKVVHTIEWDFIELDYGFNRHSVWNKHIKSIVTHEQFVEMEYKA